MRLRSLRQWWKAKGLWAASCALACVLGSTGAARGAGAHPLRVQGGVLTVDGLTVKSGLNLRVANWRYLYVYLPGAGTAVIAEQPFAGAREQRSAFHGNALTINAGGSRIQLTAANRMRGSRPAYVRFDQGTGPGTREPAVSFGDAAMVPAVWPGSEPEGRYAPRKRLKVHAGRMPRSARLCRPSPHGRELCATVREVMYKPY